MACKSFCLGDTAWVKDRGRGVCPFAVSSAPRENKAPGSKVRASVSPADWRLGLAHLSSVVGGLSQACIGLSVLMGFVYPTQITVASS